jgi:hypothetical protein
MADRSIAVTIEVASTVVTSGDPQGLRIAAS